MKRVPANRYVCFFLLAGSGLTWDLFSKHAVFSHLGYPKVSSDWVIEWFGGWLKFQLTTTFNEGALWGFGQGHTWIFAILSAVAVVGVLYWLFVLGAANSWWLTLSLALIMAGTLGNLYDRLGLHGCIVNGTIKYAVRDFLLFTFGDWNYPVFNFADVFLVTGALMLVVQSFRAEAVSDQPEDQNNRTGSSQPTSTTRQQPSSHCSFERAAMTGGPG